MTMSLVELRPMVVRPDRSGAGLGPAPTSTAPPGLVCGGGGVQDTGVAWPGAGEPEGVAGNGYAEAACGLGRGERKRAASKNPPPPSATSTPRRPSTPTSKSERPEDVP